MKKLFLTLCSFLFIAAVPKCGSRNNGDIAQAGMERRVGEVVDAFQRGDQARLNDFVHPDKGIIYIYAPGAMNIIVKNDSIVFADELSGMIDDWAPYYFKNIGLDDMDIRYESLPEFDCSEEQWSKPSGIYCDTTMVCRQISGLAEDLNKYMYEEAGLPGWSEEDIAEFRALEDAGRKFVVLGSDDHPYSNHIIFYLTHCEGEWWLSAIHFFDPCSA